MSRPIRGFLRPNQVNVSLDSYEGIYSLRDLVNYSLDGNLPSNTPPALKVLKRMGGIGENWNIDGGDGYFPNTTSQNFVVSYDGSYLYILDNGTGDWISQFKLLTPFDLTTRSNPVYWYIPDGELSPSNIAVSQNGLYLFLHGTTLDDLSCWEMSSPHDLSSATEFSRYLNWDTSAQTDMKISADGTKLYTSIGTQLGQYTMSTPYDPSTAPIHGSPSAVFDNPGGYVNDINGFCFSHDGTKLFINGESLQPGLLRYDLDTPWDISSTTFVHGATAMPARITSSTYLGLDISSDGKILYRRHNATTVYPVNLETAYDLTSAKYTFEDDLNLTHLVNPGGLYIRPDGDGYFATYNNTDFGAEVFDIKFLQGWSPSTAVHTGIMKNFSWIDAQSEDIYFKPDGTKMYLLGLGNDMITEWDLSTAWDIRTAALSYLFELAGYETTPYGFFFRKDGLKFYIVGATGDDVNEFTMSSAWDLSTATFTNVSTQKVETDAYGVEFDSDGSYCWITTNSDIIHGYPLSTAWDITSMGVDNKTLNVATGDTTPRKVRFSPDGSKFYLTGTTTDDVSVYSLSTPWDISTGGASPDSTSEAVLGAARYESFHIDDSNGEYLYAMDYVNSNVVRYKTTTPGVFNVSTMDRTGLQRFSTSAQTSTAGRMLNLSTDGTILYAGWENNDLYQYTLSTPWDLSTASYASKSLDLDLTAASTKDVAFSRDGTELYTANDNQTIVKYDLSTPWDITTATEAASSDAIVMPDPSAMESIDISPDRTKIYIADFSYGQVYQINLSTPGDLSSSSYSGQFITPLYALYGAPNISGIRVIGNKLYISDQGNAGLAGSTNSRIMTFDLADSENIGSAYFGIEDVPDLEQINVGFGANTGAGLITKDGDLLITRSQEAGATGSTMMLLDQTSRQYIDPTDSSSVPYSGSILQLPLNSDPGEKPRFSRTFNFTRNHTGKPVAMQMKPDGTKLYIMAGYSAYSNGEINEYNLTTAYDVSTAVYVKTAFLAMNYITNVNATDDYPDFSGFDISGDGRHIITSHWYNDDIRHWIMDTPWDLDTIRFKDQLNITAEYQDAHSVLYNDSGNEFYITGTGPTNIDNATPGNHPGIFSNRISIYTMDSAWHPSSASLDSDVYFATGMTEAKRMYGSPTGDYFGVANINIDEVYRLDAFDKNNSTSRKFTRNRMFNRGAWKKLSFSPTLWTGGNVYNVGWYSAGIAFSNDGTYARAWQGADNNDTSGRYWDWSISGDVTNPSNYTALRTAATQAHNSGPGYVISSTNQKYTNRVNTSQNDKWWYPSTSIGGRIYSSSFSWTTTNTNTIDYNYDEVVGFTFSSSGDKIFVSYLNGIILEYPLPTPFDQTSVANVAVAGTTSNFKASNKVNRIGDITFDRSGTLLFVLNHYVNEASWIEVWKCGIPFSLKGISKTGVIIQPPNVDIMPYDGALMLANSIDTVDNKIFVTPFYRGKSNTSTYQPLEFFYIDLDVEPDILR